MGVQGHGQRHGHGGRGPGGGRKKTSILSSTASLTQLGITGGGGGGGATGGSGVAGGGGAAGTGMGIGTLENTGSGSAYQLLAKKGEGAFSTVYAARCLRAPDRGLHERRLHSMSPPLLPVDSLVAVKRIRRAANAAGGTAATATAPMPHQSRTATVTSGATLDSEYFTGSTRRFGRDVALDSGQGVGGGGQAAPKPKGDAAGDNDNDNDNDDGDDGDEADKGLVECDLLRRLTWTTNIFVTGVRPPDEPDDDDPAAASANSRHIVDSEQGLVLGREIGYGGGVVRLFEVIETDDSLFFVMEFCHMDLYHLITSRNGLPTPIVKDLFTQIANAVQFCHENSVYHRDLKPENILIDTSDFSIRLADFGLATDNEWSENIGCGSVRYMSPECLGIRIQVDSSNNEPEKPGYSAIKNDVWSLGVILINLVFARNPWHSPKDKFCRTDYLLLQKPVLIEEFGLSAEFDNVLRRCFDPNPKTRCGVLELRDMVWRISSFTWDGPKTGNDGLEPTPPPLPAEWGAIRKVYLGVEEELPNSDATSSLSDLSRRQKDSLRKLESSIDTNDRHSGQTRKNLTLSMSALQKFLVSDPTEETTTTAAKGVEMKLDDSQLSSLTSGSENISSDDGDYHNLESDNIFKQDFRPNFALRERSSSLNNGSKPSLEHISSNNNNNINGNNNSNPSPILPAARSARPFNFANVSRSFEYDSQQQQAQLRNSNNSAATQFNAQQPLLRNPLYLSTPNGSPHPKLEDHVYPSYSSPHHGPSHNNINSGSNYYQSNSTAPSPQQYSYIMNEYPPSRNNSITPPSGSTTPTSSTTAINKNFAPGINNTPNSNSTAAGYYYSAGTTATTAPTATGRQRTQSNEQQNTVEARAVIAAGLTTPIGISSAYDDLVIGGGGGIAKNLVGPRSIGSGAGAGVRRMSVSSNGSLYDSFGTGGGSEWATQGRIRRASAMPQIKHASFINNNSFVVPGGGGAIPTRVAISSGGGSGIKPGYVGGHAALDEEIYIHGGGVRRGQTLNLNLYQQQLQQQQQQQQQQQSVYHHQQRFSNIAQDDDRASVKTDDSDYNAIFGVHNKRVSSLNRGGAGTKSIGGKSGDSSDYNSVFKGRG
ncbi:hypothetical protein HK100_004473 [Physocladia obscura]|uniref:Protein kinase domain-containing protein n=1 Tax=Physocladia obscura TaxID=109957 RepID=A0AAD5T8T1_9FUNG|nr:hypothetical protein HK100_004473 [Physocladia obscura]